MASKITKGIIITFWVLFAAAVGTVFLIFYRNSEWLYRVYAAGGTARKSYR